MKPISVTVVIPTWNCERFLQKAIESALEQTYTSTKVLVIDDGSTDDTFKIIQKFHGKLDYHYKTNQGTSSAWNYALDVAKTPYLIGLDADDEFLPDTVAKTMQYALRYPKASLVYSDYEFIDKEGLTTKTVSNPDPDYPIAQLIKLHDSLGQPNNFLPFGHVRLYKREAMIEIGGFDIRYQFSEDYDLVLRLAEHGHQFVHIPQVLYRYRWHDSNKGIISRSGQIVEVRHSLAAYRNRQNLYEV